MAIDPIQRLSTLAHSSKSLDDYALKVADAKVAAAEQVSAGTMTAAQAAEALGVSSRMVEHLVQLFGTQGHDGLEKNLVIDQKAGQGRMRAAFDDVIANLKKAFGA